MKKAIVISFFHSSNLGDLLLSDQICKLIENNYEVVRIDFGSGRLIESKISEIEIVNQISPTKKISRLKKALIPFYIYFNLKFAKKNIDYDLLLRDASVVFIGGGNMLMDLSLLPDYSLRFWKYVKLANRLEVPTHLIFSGVGPFENSMQRRYIKKASALCKTLVVRDDISKETLLQCGVKGEVSVLPDPAFLLPSKNRSENDRSVIAINVYLNVSQTKIYDAYVALIKMICESFPTKNIVLFSTEGMDYSVIKEIYSDCVSLNCKNLTMRYILSLDDLLDLYQHSICAVTTRMHSAIIATTQNIPVIPIVWQNKINGLFQYMELGFTLYSQSKIVENIDNIFADIHSYISDDSIRVSIEKRVESIRSLIINEFKNTYF